MKVFAILGNFEIPDEMNILFPHRVVHLGCSHLGGDVYVLVAIFDSNLFHLLFPIHEIPHIYGLQILQILNPYRISDML